MNPFEPNQNKRNISYISTNFDKIKQSLVDYSKYYYPNTFKDFSEGSVGMMFTEQVAYVGDILSFYVDSRLQESLINYAGERKSLINHARANGYKVKTTTPSQTILDVYQVVPSKINSLGEHEPDLSVVQNIKEGMTCQTSDSISFITRDPVDFNINTPSSPRDSTVYARDQDGFPQSYLIKKSVNAFSATKKTVNINISDPIPARQIELEEDNVIFVESVVDSQGNRWYEVDYLAQENIPVAEDINFFFGEDSARESNVPKLLKYIKTSNKFITHVTENNTTIIEFGSGTDSGFDEQVTFAPFNPNDKFTYRKTNTYGRTPTNTTLTITYYFGGGVDSNVVSNSITNLARIEYEASIIELNPDIIDLYRDIRRSTRVTNPIPATGGGGPDTDEEIRQNAILKSHSQNRLVSQLDYESLIYSMPSIYGKVDKVWASRDLFKDNVVNIYILSSNSEGNLIPPSEILLENVKTYVNNYRMLSERIQIIPGHIINIGVEYKIKVVKGFSKQEVLSNTKTVVKEFFDAKNQGFFKPIDISQVQLKIGNVTGVQSVSYVKVKNLTAANGEYSRNEYDIDYATRDNMIYPSQDPSIFEVKYPSIDIKGILS
jgi:hypothetical protein